MLQYVTYPNIFYQIIVKSYFISSLYVLINLVKIRFDHVKVGFSLFSNSVGVYSYLFTLRTDRCYSLLSCKTYCFFKNDIQYMYRYVNTESAQYPGQISRKNNIGM